MQVTVDIKTCQDCRYLDHSGAFTFSGPKPVCNGPNVVEHATKNKQVNKKDADDKYHWRHRRIKDTNKIPGWCPLKQGEAY